MNTPKLITDSDGNTVWKWDAEAFDNTPPTAETTGEGPFVFNLRFPGQYYDAMTDLFYNNNRDFDPSTERYVESDPLGLNDGQISTYSNFRALARFRSVNLMWLYSQPHRWTDAAIVVVALTKSTSCRCYLHNYQAKERQKLLASVRVRSSKSRLGNFFAKQGNPSSYKPRKPLLHIGESQQQQQQQLQPQPQNRHATSGVVAKKCG